MSTETAGRRPMGALGRMGIVAALHVGALYLIASSLGLVPSVKPTITEGRIIDEAPREDDVIPEHVPYTPPHQDTVFVPEPEAPPFTYEQDVITGPPPDIVER